MRERKLVETNEEFQVYAQTSEDFLRQYEYKAGTLEQSLDDYIRSICGKDRYGFREREFTGVRREPEEMVFGCGANGEFYPTDKELLNSDRFWNALRAGEAFYIPAIGENGELDMDNPKIVKCMTFEGEEHLLILSERDLRHAEAELQHVYKPTFWQKLADRFLKIFGSRYEACVAYENFQAQLSGTFQNMRSGYQRVMTAESARKAHEAEQKALAEKKYVLQEYTRIAPTLIKRNMNADDFEKLLNTLVEEGTQPLEDIGMEYSVRITHETLIARALVIPAEEMLEQAAKATDRKKFLEENIDAFLLLIKDLEAEARKADLTAVDEIATTNPVVEYGDGRSTGQVLVERLGKLDADMLHLCANYRYQQTVKKRLEEEERKREQERQEELRRKEENREQNEEMERKIKEATRRRDEALRKNPLSPDDIAFYMENPNPVEEFVLQNPEVFMKKKEAAGDFPAGNSIDEFPKEADFGEDFPQEDGFGAKNDTKAKQQEAAVEPANNMPENNPWTISNPFANPFDDGTKTNDNASVNEQQQKQSMDESPFEDPFKVNIYGGMQQTSNDDPFANPVWNVPQPAIVNPFANPFDDGSKTNDNASVNEQQQKQSMDESPFEDPFKVNIYGDMQQTSNDDPFANPVWNVPQPAIVNPFANPFDDGSKTNDNASVNEQQQKQSIDESPFEDPFKVNICGDMQQTSNDDPFANPVWNVPQSANVNPFDNPFEAAPQTTQPANDNPFANPFEDAPQPQPQRQSGGLSR